jgi:hypothetical protein
MSRRKEPVIPSDLLDQLLAGGDAAAALQQGGFAPIAKNFCHSGTDPKVVISVKTALRPQPGRSGLYDIFPQADSIAD